MRAVGHLQSSASSGAATTLPPLPPLRAGPSASAPARPLVAAAAPCCIDTTRRRRWRWFQARCDGRHGHPPYHPPPQDVSIKPAVARGAARRRHHSRSYRTSTRFAAAARPPRLGVSPPHHTAATTTTAHRHLRRCEFDSPSRANRRRGRHGAFTQQPAVASGGVDRSGSRQPAAGSRRLVVTRTTPAGFGDGAGAADRGPCSPPPLGRPSSAAFNEQRRATHYSVILICEGLV